MALLIAFLEREASFLIAWLSCHLLLHVPSFTVIYLLFCSSFTVNLYFSISPSFAILCYEYCLHEFCLLLCSFPMPLTLLMQNISFGLPLQYLFRFVCVELVLVVLKMTTRLANFEDPEPASANAVVQ